jgi:hypothetical protein
VLAMFFGYRILVDLIALVWNIAMLVLRTSGRARR